MALMLNKLVGLIAITAIGAVVASASSAAVLIPGGSSFKVNIAALPTITITGTYAGDATLTNGVGGGHDISTTAGLFQGSGITAGTTLLTGVALIDNMTLTATNQAASYTSNFASGVLSNNPWGGGLAATNPNFSAGSGTLCATGCLGAGGTATAGNFSGALVLQIAGAPVLFPLTTLGLGGVETFAVATGISLKAAGGPWITGKVQITGITTNVISVPGRGPGGPGPAGGATGVGVTLNLTTMEYQTAMLLTTMGAYASTASSMGIVSVRNTVNVGGTQNLASSAAGGVVTLISPVRIDASALGWPTLPGVFRQSFKFVPEPGTVLLLVSGAAGLVALGRRRMKS
jgi:hypothetical protein